MFVVLLGYGIAVEDAEDRSSRRPNRPAAVAGLKAGDVLVEANGQAVDAEHPISEVIQRGAGRAGHASRCCATASR